MEIESIHLKGFRNFNDSFINFNKSTLIIGSNDVGKSNMLHALRILLDKSLSDADIEPSELDFHIGKQDIAAQAEITITFKDIKEDAVLSILKGHVSDDGKTILKYIADRSNLSYKLLIGYSPDEMQEIGSRFYLKYINLKYIQSQRDLEGFIRKEKKQLLRIAQQLLTDEDAQADELLLSAISSDLSQLNEKISQLKYVNSATNGVNHELSKLAHHYSDYEVKLDTGAIEVNDFIDKLKLGAATNGSNVMLGGDGRNNQILLALWKAKSMIEQDTAHEVIFYVIEEPEAHLHPHQQRKLATYLIKELPGQILLSSHSPQIAVNFSPESIIRLYSKNGATIAASNGCSKCISDSWEDMNYRMSVLPAEVFFSSGVFLVEGPSEILFYNELAQALNIDLDFENISILSVDGISFRVYIGILNALNIPWVMRTDNDVSKVPNITPDCWQYAGINRCLKIAGKRIIPHSPREITTQDTHPHLWNHTSTQINEKGIYLSKIDLESDLVEELSEYILRVLRKRSNNAAISYLQQKKAIRMRALLSQIKLELRSLEHGELAKPLHHLISMRSASL
ncbi:TPA: ATP-dependent nuclease [Photobacterium damselae]